MENGGSGDYIPESHRLEDFPYLIRVYRARRHEYQDGPFKGSQITRGAELYEANDFEDLQIKIREIGATVLEAITKEVFIEHAEGWYDRYTPTTSQISITSSWPGLLVKMRAIRVKKEDLPNKWANDALRPIQDEITKNRSRFFRRKIHVFARFDRADLEEAD